MNRSPLRFVILVHDHPFVHWDLMLEQGETLKSWRLLNEPVEFPIDAEPLDDHRTHYLDYEGPVSGNRGAVSQWDAGTYEVSYQADGLLLVRLMGNRLSGTFRLAATNVDSQWRFSSE